MKMITDKELEMFLSAYSQYETLLEKLIYNMAIKRGIHCEKCATDYDECPCNTCARDNYSRARARTTDCCEKHKRERIEED